MKRDGLLNAELNHAIASLGHGDGLLVVDAGFPIPRSAWRIDLALTRDVPDLRTVLAAIAQELIVESIELATEVETSNPRLWTWVADQWPTAAITTVPHADFLPNAPQRAKAVVRTGAFEPWGNILLRSGVDAPAWFDDDSLVVPEYYRDAVERGRPR